MSQKEIHVYYHVCLKNDGMMIANEQLHLLSMSTLLYRATSVKIGIKYIHEYEKDKFLNIINQYNLMNNIEILYCESNYENDNQELSTALKFKEYSDSLDENTNNYILYFHTKGIGHYNKPAQNPVKFWRNYMEYFLLENWKSSVHKLNEGYESCGTFKTNISVIQEFLKKSNPNSNIEIEYNTNKFYYPGTFFWMNTSLIKRIPKKYFYNNTEYMRWSIEALPAFIEHNHWAFSCPNPPSINLYSQVLHPLQYIV